MKKLLLTTIFLVLAGTANAYTIGGAFAELIKCEWGQYGYEYGNIGTYKANGQLYKVFFGAKYCEY